MDTMIKKDRTKIKAMPEFRYLGCPMTKNRTPWCFRICKPGVDKLGQCGRLAPHSLRSRIQMGIDGYKISKTMHLIDEQ